MFRGALEYVFQMSAVQLKTLLNAMGKVVDNAGTFLLSDCFNFLIGFCLQCCYSVNIDLIDIVLVQPPEERFSWGFRFDVRGDHTTSAWLLMIRSPDFPWNHAMVSSAVLRGTLSCQKHLFSLSRYSRTLSYPQIFSSTGM